ncbi:MAG: ATP-dependent DNA helicase [Candidatus Andersenbacteria bacterium]
MISSPHSGQVFKKLYQELNPAQRQAVDAIEGVVIVLAGPGTGKTQILALRIAKILQETQMDPYNILCLTFTESGVAAMRKRLVTIIGPAAYYVRIHTFHSFCNDIIQEYPEKFTFARDLEVLSEVERLELFREIIDELPGTSPLKPFGNPYLFLSDIAGNIQSLKQEHVTSRRYQAVVTATKKLVVAMAPLIQPLITSSTAERTPAAVAEVHQELMALRSQFSRLAPHFDRLEKMYGRFTAAAPAAERRAVGKLVTKYKNDLKRFTDSLTNRLPKQQDMKKVYEAYQQKMRTRGRYDYEDMILFVAERFKEDEELLARYQEQFQYILVDEYQDTNGAQNEAIYLLGQFHDNPNIFVVGDDKQSIYRFQGASLENLLFLYEQYRDSAQVIVLEDNYRSQQAILDAAAAIISHNEESVERYLPAAQAPLRAQQAYEPKPIDILQFDNGDMERYGIAQKIQALLTAGVPAPEIAVLYRRNADAADFAEAMRKQGIPVQVESGHNILDDIIIQQFLEVLRYLQDPRRGDTLWNILHYEFWQLSTLDVLKAQAYAREQKLDLFRVMSTPEHLAASGVKQPRALLTLTQKIAAWQALLHNRPLPDFVAHVLRESGLLNYVLLQADHLNMLNCITTLFTDIKLQDRHQRLFTLGQFLAYVDLLTVHRVVVPAARLQSQREAVRLMTAHRAKGLEFEHVFIVRACDRHWGNLHERTMVPLPQGLLQYDKITGEENNEDERRLFYVALTRARRMAHISWAHQSSTGRAQVPAIFVEEIPPALKTVQVVEEKAPATLARLSMAVTPVEPAAPNEQLTTYITMQLEQYVLSVTHLNNYLRCPRLFYYRNLLRVPSVKNKHMAFGTAIHGALYDFCSRITHDHLPTAKDLTQSFIKHLRRESLTEAEYRDALDVGTKVLREYYEHYRDTCSRTNLLEYNFSAHGVVVDSVPLTGMIDKVEIDAAARSAHVVDYKTGNPDTKRAALQRGGDYHRQLVFYKLLGDSSPRFPYDIHSGEIDFVEKSPSKKAYIKKKYGLTTTDTKALRVIIQQVWRDINALRFLAPDNEQFCGQCEYCLLVAAGKLSA